MTEHPRADLYARVTDKIIADLEQGTRPWHKPWSVGNDRLTVLPLRANGTPYRGINVLLLWGASVERGYSRNQWMTYRQAAERGAQVRKGEHGNLVVYADRFTTTEQNDKGENVEREIPFLKAYTVFNVEQIDGLPTCAHQPHSPIGEGRPAEVTDEARGFFAETGADIRHGGDHAFYAPASDHVQMPPPKRFRDAESYCATLAHELTHWTSHPSRLDRQLGNRFGDDAYAAEELIAEMGAAFVCAELALTPETRDDHAAYLAHWLRVLKADKRAIFTAAAQAQRAADFLLAFRGETVDALPAWTPRCDGHAGVALAAPAFRGGQRRRRGADLLRPGPAARRRTARLEGSSYQVAIG